MSDKIQQTLVNTPAALSGLVMEECNFNYNLQQNANNIQTQNYFNTTSSLPQNGILYSNSFNSSQLPNNIKINTLNVFGECGNNNDPNFFMNSFDQEPSSPRNDYAYIIKKEYCFCDQQEQLFQNTQNFDFFNDKPNNSFNNNLFNRHSSKNQFGNNQSNNSKNNNQGDKCLSFFFDCSPSVNPFTQGINNNIYPQDCAGQQQQQQNQLGLCQNMNNVNQNMFADIPQLMKADSIVDGIQNEIPAHFLQDISFERSQRIQQTRFAESGKSYQFDNSFNLAGFQQSQSSQNGIASQSQNQIFSLIKQNQIISNYPQQDQFQNIAEEINLQINTKKEEETQSTGNFNPKQEQYYNLNGFPYQDEQNENFNFKGIDQVSNRDCSTRSHTYFNQNQQNNIVSASNIDSTVNDDEESKSCKKVDKKKRICKKKEKSKEAQSPLAIKLETERIVEQKEDRKRGKKTLYYKGSDGKQKKFARITKSMIRPVCNAVCKYLRSYGAKVEKIDWLNQLRSFLIENSKFIPTAVDFFENHFEKYVNSSPKLIEKSEYLLFKENWIRGVSDPANFKGLKQTK
ncbi:hypothetical protein TTHERM_00189190 (macronuclear) [Tetrahymena thermophila SB210]|uniref:Uncharacterized protein n=1 Tax=Tetrahymena thermophila (strain SB210) TaxID=312017 RepID=I7MJH5_TETTS|nr:hypothetical protein TTHERM_00189190 [Tetrahymena thermophila SB210]EAR96350.1 hypothetical protein TTHERM_00189190 [Tetrahymena thermophila SB210]|eukprot:XP_001016595.1 hypothetical protein TTHERM_00189190 [Tetrahymena thermophila SB210]